MDSSRERYRSIVSTFSFGEEVAQGGVIVDRYLHESRISAMTAKNRSVPVDTVLPHVSYQNLGEAMAWLTRTFGFREYYRYGDGPSGGQMWAGKAAIQVRQAGSAQKSPAQLGYGTQSVTLFVEDVDRHHARAKAAGAKILEEPHETEYGEYQYAAEDLDGHRWLFSRHAKDRSPEEWGAIVNRVDSSSDADESQVTKYPHFAD